MKTLLHDLGTLLARQVDQLRTLESLMRSQQQALARKDVEAILESISGQEACLAGIQALEDERVRLMRRISSVLGMGEGAITLRELTDRLEPEVGSELRETGRAIRDTLQNIGRVNQDNRRLIQHSLDFVQEMLAAWTGSVPTKRVYEPSGALSPRPQGRTLIDQVT